MLTSFASKMQAPHYHLIIFKIDERVPEPTRLISTVIFDDPHVSIFFMRMILYAQVM